MMRGMGHSADFPEGTDPEPLSFPSTTADAATGSVTATVAVAITAAVAVAGLVHWVAAGRLPCALLPLCALCSYPMGVASLLCLKYSAVSRSII